MANVFDNLFLSSSSTETPPNVDGRLTLIDGELRVWDGPSIKVKSPIRRQKASLKDGESDEIEIGDYAMVDKKDSILALDAACKAYDAGRGVWPKMQPSERIEAVKKFAAAMKAKRLELAKILMWEICKNRADAEKEVDRTVDYILDTVSELTKMENRDNGVAIEAGIISQTKRAPLGIALVAGPANYPLNEFATLFVPAIIMGNTVIIKTPRTGGLVHIPLLEAYRDCFPPGVVNVLHGSGREVFTPIMADGRVNIFGFIGTHKAAQSLHSVHPHPFSVRLALGLDAKNPGIVTPSADLDVATTELTLGSLSFNGQRCTAIKIIFAHESVADELAKRLTESISKLKMALPWEDGAKITPLLEENKSEYIAGLVKDAVEKGAKVLFGNKFDRSFAQPTLLYPCTLDSQVCKDEQFGPVVPIVKYKDFSEVEKYLVGTMYGQQASLFTKDASEVPKIIDFLRHHVTRINLNAQCQRGPDSMPFSGRKVSATGTLSVHDALRTMSIRCAFATKQAPTNVKLVQDVFKSHASNTLNSDVIISNL